MDKRINKILNNKGTTLMELTVATGIFIIVVMAAGGIFQGVIEGQRNAIAAQNTQESLRYILEVMSKEIRQAQKNLNDCTPNGFSVTDSTYNTGAWGDTEELFFYNRDDECVEYFLRDGVLMITKDDGATTLTGSTTPDEIEVTDLDFYVDDYLVGTPPGSREQPKVTIKMKVKMRGGRDIHKHEYTIQTTVSSRRYK